MKCDNIFIPCSVAFYPKNNYTVYYSKWFEMCSWFGVEVGGNQSKESFKKIKVIYNEMKYYMF